ncbi:unnamed protein product, partial [Rangifer tarandus platyrhynchus]
SQQHPRTGQAKVQRLKDRVLVCQHQHSLELMRSRNAWSFTQGSLHHTSNSHGCALHMIMYMFQC